MTRRQQLSEAQISDLFDPPTGQRDLVHHYTLSDADLAAIRRCRGNHNRLGYALMPCYLRHPGRALRAGERPPSCDVGRHHAGSPSQRNGSSNQPVRQTCGRHVPPCREPADTGFPGRRPRHQRRCAFTPG